MGRALRPGEEVDWTAPPDAAARGRVAKKMARKPNIEDHAGAVPSGNPMAESEKTGKRAAQKRKALKKHH